MINQTEKHELFLIHWNEKEAEELASTLREDGWEVTIEHGSGQLKMSELRQTLPKALVISLRRLPSHGREVADALWSSKWGREIPIIFFDGAPDKVIALHDQFPDAIFTTYEDLIPILNNL